MRFPEGEVEIDGERVNIGKPIEEAGGEFESDAIYRDSAGNFYVARIQRSRSDAEALELLGGEVTMPRDKHAWRAAKGSTLAIKRISEQAALVWYADNFMNDTPLYQLMLQAVSGYVSREERRGKVPVTAWVPAQLRARLRKLARSRGCTEGEQLELFAVEATGDDKRPRLPRKKRRIALPLPGQQLVQMQLVTSLVLHVETIAKIDRRAQTKAAVREVLGALATVKDATKTAAA